MRSLATILMIFMLTISGVPFASAQLPPDAFSVEVSPSSFGINTPVDVTIKAIRANGDIIKDYEGDVFIDVNGVINTSEYTVPSEGYYSFLPQDQGVKTFSKGLIIKKEGIFSLDVNDFTDDSSKGKKDIIVGPNGGHNAQPSNTSITIISPTKDSTVKSDVAEIIGNGNIKNSPFEILSNGISAYVGTTDDNGNFVGYITELQEGKNTINVRILDIDDTILANSIDVNFTYSPSTDGNFNSIQLLPGNTIKAGEVVTFNVKTSESVNSVSLKLSNGTSAPMDKESDGLFTKELTLDTKGKFDISLDISANNKNKTYSNVSMVIVGEGTKIGKVRIFSDSVYKQKLTITREVEGSDVSKYLVNYGTTAEELTQTQTVSEKELILENLTQGSKYYFKITPLDTNNKISGTASEIVSSVIGEDGATSCTVQGIKINDIIEGNTHYLTRSGVQNIEKYIIYRSEEKTTIENMQKISETTDTKFEYTFNPNAKEEKYTYYAIQALCKNGKAIVIDDVKKVKTGPIENILLFIFVSLLFYGTYKVYGFNDI